MRTVARFAWGLLAYDIAVVAWGAYVRATGSGAGCGRHWPTCNGELVPRAPRVSTLIELSHRVSSGVALLLTVALWLLMRRAFPAGHRARRCAAAGVALMGTEALIGAGLVLFELVARDASLKRALGVSLHLVNTFLLLAATALAAWWASGGTGGAGDDGQRAGLRARPFVVVALGCSLAMMLAVGVSGAVTALGDTLFPASSLTEGLTEDFASSAHAFVRLRAVHPLLAIATAAVIVGSMGLARAAGVGPAARAMSRMTTALAVSQVAAGVLDLTLLAPVYLQLLHLVIADLVWIALVLATAAALTQVPARATGSEPELGLRRAPALPP